MWETEYGLVCLWDAYVSPTERLRGIHLFWTAGRFFTIWATRKAAIHVKRESNPLPGFVFHLGYGVLAALYSTVYDSGENPSMQDINCGNPSRGYQQGILFRLSTRWLNIGLSVKLSGLKEKRGFCQGQFGFLFVYQACLYSPSKRERVAHFTVSALVSAMRQLGGVAVPYRKEMCFRFGQQIHLHRERWPSSCVSFSPWAFCGSTH